MAARHRHDAILTLIKWSVPFGTGLYFVGALVSALLAHSGYYLTSRVIRDFYSHFCHQMPERSLTLWGIPLAFCARCTGFYGALFGASLLFAIFDLKLTLRLPLAIILMLPMAVDFAFDLSASSQWANWLRLLVGLVGGAGLIWFSYPRLLRLLRQERLAE